MMREFGVEFVTKRGNRYSEKVIAEFVHDSCYGEIEDDAFYVAKESEEIFKPKNYDLAGFTREDGISTVGQYSKDRNAFINGNFKIPRRFYVRILPRLSGIKISIHC